jgi:VWFA-related protein
MWLAGGVTLILSIDPERPYTTVTMVNMSSVVLALAIGGMAVADPQRPAERRAPGPLLQIDAVALDGNDNPVTDLRREDLEVWIEHYRVPIETLTFVMPGSGDGGGRVIVLLLDDVAVPLASMPRVREAARRFVNRMSPGDRMAIVSLNGDEMKSTDDRARLLRSIDGYSVKAVSFQRPDLAGEHILKTVAALSRQLAEESTGRKTIVGIGAAWLFDTPIPPPTVGRDLRPEWTSAMRAMGFANVTFYAIDPGGIGTSRFGGSDGFARVSGGHAFVNTNDLNGAVDRVMREAGSYYIIEVRDPPVGRKASLRELDVRGLRRGVTVRARQRIPGTEVPEVPRRKP